MSSVSRSVLIVAGLGAIFALAHATGATAPGSDRPAAQATGRATAHPAVARPSATPTPLLPTVTWPAARSPAALHRRTHAAGVVLWANAGVDHLSDPEPRAARARLLVGLMRAVRARLGLLAETSAAQVRDLRRAAHGTFAVVPGRLRGATNAVVYDVRAYRLERRISRFRTYAYGGRLVPTPLLVLRDRRTGARLAVLAVHHPATNAGRGSQVSWQQAAWDRELRVLARLHAIHHGRISVLLGGDFNASDTCPVLGATGLVSPVGTVSSCPTARTRIDQLFADPTVTFDGYHAFIRGAARRATDHAGVYVAAFRLRQPA